jgi:integrase
MDICPVAGRARLSYRRAAALFARQTGGLTLHQLRHSALTDLAEAGESTVLLMAKSRHRSLRSPQRYARPGPEAVAALTARHDSARRRSQARAEEGKPGERGREFVSDSRPSEPS